MNHLTYPLIYANRIFLMDMVTVLMMSAKMASLGLLKIKVMMSFYVLKLYCRCGHLSKVLETLNISMRKLIITSILLVFDRKNYFFDGWSWFQFNNFAQGMALKLYTSVAKGLKLKFRRFRRLIPTIVEVTVENWQGGPFCSLFFSLPPILSRVEICPNEREFFRMNNGIPERQH